MKTNEALDFNAFGFFFIYSSCSTYFGFIFNPDLDFVTPKYFELQKQSQYCVFVSET